MGQFCYVALSLSLYFESVFLFQVCLVVSSQSCFVKSRVISGMLPQTSLACFVFVFSFSFESVSALEPVTPEDLNGIAVIFTLLCLLLPCASCARNSE